MDELWDIARVAAYLGVTERTVYNKVRSGELPAVRIGRLWRVRAADLEAWLAAGTARRAGASGAADLPVAVPLSGGRKSSVHRRRAGCDPVPRGP
jgi:excisionase family DNA binding protein